MSTRKLQAQILILGYNAVFWHRIWGNGLILPLLLLTFMLIRINLKYSLVAWFGWCQYWYMAIHRISKFFSAEIEIDVPCSVAYDCYSDRELIPEWMPFISSVKVHFLPLMKLTRPLDPFIKLSYYISWGSSADRGWKGLLLINYGTQKNSIKLSILFSSKP